MIDLSQANSELALEGARTVASLPIEQRLDYLRVLAALAGADGILGGRELGALEAYCDRLGVGYEHRTTVFESARRVDPKRVTAVCETFRKSDLRFSLLTDLLVIAMSDHTYGDAERVVIDAIADLLDIQPHQLRAMETYADRTVRNLGRPRERRGDDDPTRDRNLALASAGFAAVAVLGSVYAAGFDAHSDHFASGLIRLGFGLGAVIGMAVALSIGAIAFFAAHAALQGMVPAPKRDAPRIVR